MQMECRKCKRVMHFGEFIVAAELYFLKMIVKEAVPFLIDAIKEKFFGAKKGFLDLQMIGLANNFSVSCPNFKNFECWDAISIVIEKEQQKENQAQAS